MYVPNHFREDNTHTLQQYIRDYSFGLLIVADAEGIDALIGVRKKFDDWLYKSRERNRLKLKIECSQSTKRVNLCLTLLFIEPLSSPQRCSACCRLPMQNSFRCPPWRR